MKITFYSEQQLLYLKVSKAGNIFIYVIQAKKYGRYSEANIWFHAKMSEMQGSELFV